MECFGFLIKNGLPLALFSLLMLGCGDDDSSEIGGDNGSSGMGGVPGSTIRGSVTYTGTLSGGLNVGVYLSCPPAGPPVGGNNELVPQPNFPRGFEFTGVQPGSYSAVAILDVGNNNPTFPGQEDILSCSSTVEVSDAEGAVADIDLDNPM